jgi:DNA-directed RNA polymerase subunit beta'
MENYHIVALSPELEEAPAQVGQGSGGHEAEERELEAMRMEGEQGERAAE